MQVKFVRKALRDLDDEAAYIATYSPQAAQQFMAAVHGGVSPNRRKFRLYRLKVFFTAKRVHDVYVITSIWHSRLDCVLTNVKSIQLVFHWVTQ